MELALSIGLIRGTCGLGGSNMHSSEEGIKYFNESDRAALDFYIATRKSRNTATVYRLGILTFFESARKPPADIRAEDVAHFFKEVVPNRMNLGEWSASYVRIMKASVKGFFKFYHGTVTLDKERLAELLLAVPQGDIGYYVKDYTISSAELTMLLTALYGENGYRERPLLAAAYLALGVGLSYDEIFAIRTGSFFTCDKGVGVTVGKGKSLRNIVLPGCVTTVINDYLYKSGWDISKTRPGASIFEGQAGRVGLSQVRIRALYTEVVDKLYGADFILSKVTYAGMRTIFIRNGVRLNKEALRDYCKISEDHALEMLGASVSADPAGVLKGLVECLGIDVKRDFIGVLARKRREVNYFANPVVF